MRVMIFLDDSNFFNSICAISSERKQDLVIDYHKVNHFVSKYLSNNVQYKHKKPFHVRSYLYDGEYTDALINKMKSSVSRSSGEEQTRLNSVLEKAKKRAIGQKQKFKRLCDHHYFEVRLKPLQFTIEKEIFQKGVDVQLAVDLVSNAYLDNYDVAVLFSGDIDLLESIKLVKSLGKQVIIFSHSKHMAVEMRRVADMFVNMQKLHPDQLKEFTHIFEKR